MLRRNRNRQRVFQEETKDGAAEEEEAISDDPIECFDDTLAAIQLIVERNSDGFERLGIPPLVIWHQLYSVLPNRTFVDQNIQRLRQNGAVVTLNIPTGSNEFAVVRYEDYKALVEKCERAASIPWTFQEHGGASDDSRCDLQAALRMFRQSLHLIAKLPIATVATLVQTWSALGNHSYPIDEAASRKSITCLQRHGFLIPAPRLEDDAYHLSMPGIGKFVVAITKTRKAILSTLRRAKYKEAFVHQLDKMKLRHSVLRLDYHLSEMEGQGYIRRTRVTSGCLVGIIAS